MRADRSPPVHLAAPETLQVSTTASPGCSKLCWPPVRGAVMYVIEETGKPSDDASWKHTGFSTRSRRVVNGATPGQARWYRVAAVNAEGQGPWSGAACRPVL